jgi:hypothetical protein
MFVRTMGGGAAAPLCCPDIHACNQGYRRLQHVARFAIEFIDGDRVRTMPVLQIDMRFSTNAAYRRLRIGLLSGNRAKINAKCREFFNRSVCLTVHAIRLQNYPAQHLYQVFQIIRHPRNALFRVRQIYVHLPDVVATTGAQLRYFLFKGFHNRE